MNKLKMHSTAVVFELADWYHIPLMWWYQFSGRQVVCLQFALRCNRSVWVKKQLVAGRIRRCTLAEPLHLRPSVASDFALTSCERVYDVRYASSRMIQRMIRLFQDERVHLAFKKSLAEELFHVHQLDLLFQKLEKTLGIETELLVIPARFDTAWKIELYKRILYGAESARPSSLRVRVPWWGTLAGAVCVMYRKGRWWGHGLYSMFLGIYRYVSTIVRRQWPRQTRPYAIALRSPTREMANRVRGVDFLLDGQQLTRDNTVFLPIARVTTEHIQWFSKEGYHLGDLHGAPPIKDLLRILRHGLFVLMRSCVDPEWMVQASSYLLSEYVTWTGFFTRYQVQHFITYCDFGIRHVGRNILLNKQGITTWHYTDTVNTAAAFSQDDGCRYRQEQWGYMLYDRFVSWSPWFSRFHQQHHQVVGQYVDVGVLWAEHVRLFREGSLRSDLLERAAQKGFRQGQKLVSVFDSSYHDETLTTYKDGIEFLRGVKRLADDLPEVFVILKEKTPRALLGLYSYDPDELREMKEILEQLDAHPRCYLPGQGTSASELIAFSCLVICYPFTSTGIEALASHVMALYYDPTAKFRKTFYTQILGLVAHDYTALQQRVRDILFQMSPDDVNRFFATYVKGDLEPYMDGKAISRFRILLTDSSSLSKQNFFRAATSSVCKTAPTEALPGRGLR